MPTNSIDDEVKNILNQNSTGSKKKKRWGKKTKIAIGVMLALIAIVFIVRLFTGNKKMLIPVDSEVLSKGHIEDSVSVTGPVGGTDSVTITSGIHAKITEIRVKEGDEVVEGQTVLAQIDTEELQSKVETAKGQYELAVAQKEEKAKNDQIGYTKASQALAQAQLDYNRKAELVAGEVVPQSDLDAARSTLNQAQSDVDQYKFKDGKLTPGDSYDIQINNAKLELERLEKQLEDATLIAPISGTVTRVYAKVGRFADQAVDNNPTLITIEKLDKLEINLAVSEYSIGKVKVGQKVLISADILGKGNTVEGRVEKISPSGEPKEGSSSSSERVIPVKVSIKDRGGLISGIGAKASIISEEKDDVYVVPIAAVGDDGNGNSVMQFITVTKEGKGIIKTVKVETGIEGEVQIELLESSLKDMDTSKEIRYVAKYDPNLVEGMEVDYGTMDAMKAANAKQGQSVEGQATSEEKVNDGGN